MALTIQDIATGSSVKLRGEKLEMFEEQLLQMVNYEIDDAEDYLEDSIRPRISENYDYYNKELPKHNPGEPTFVDNTCQATVDHGLANCLDAFTSNDTVEVIPEGVTNPIVIKFMNSAINGVLDSENNRYALYHSLFKDALISGASIAKPHVYENSIIDKQVFIDIPPEEVAMRLMSLEMSGKWDEVEVVVSEETRDTIAMETVVPVQGRSRKRKALGDVELESAVIEQEVVKQSGFFSLMRKERTIKIEQIPAENFLINREAKSIDQANFVGHKAMVTVGSLLTYGFDEEKVAEVAEKEGVEDDPLDNLASNSRRRNVIGDEVDIMSIDCSMREIELFEVYIRTALEETVGKDEGVVAIPKLYQAFVASGVLLAYQEVDDVPYVGSSPDPVPHMFWGSGLVDKTKDIQRAKTGLLRQRFVTNDLVNKPRFMFNPDNILDARDLMNNAAGTGVAVSNINDAIQPFSVGAGIGGDTAQMMADLEVQRENGTGVSYTGQSLMGDALRAGASTISAQMVLTEQQKAIKVTIQTLMEGSIKPLMKKIYNLLRENFDSWEVTVDGQTFNVNPNAEWPRLRDVKIVTPLGKTAKLERAQTYMSLYSTLTSAQGEAAKLVNPSRLRQLLISAYEMQDIPEISAYLNTEEEVQGNDMMNQQMQQMQQTLQQLQMQMKVLTDQNQVLSVQASAMAQKELEIREREMLIREKDSERKDIEASARMENMADEQIRKQEETDGKLANMADKYSLEEAEFQLKEALSGVVTSPINTSLSF